MKEDIDEQVNETNLLYLNIGKTSEVVGGQKVYAMGSPQGFDNTITEGLISNPNRQIDVNGYEDGISFNSRSYAYNRKTLHKSAIILFSHYMHVNAVLNH